MKKIAIFFVVFLLFSFQQVLKLTHKGVCATETLCERGVETEFSEGNNFPGLLGDINPGQIFISVSEVVTKYCLSKDQFKQLQNLLTLNSTKYNLLLANNYVFGLSFHRIIYIPIYLQSENFRL